MTLGRHARGYLVIGGVQWLVDWGVMVLFSHWGMVIELANILGRVAGGGTYAVVCARTRSTECSRGGRRDEHDAESGQACLPFRRFRADRKRSDEI